MASAPGPRPSLAVCMIVRDEAALLPRCLESLDGLYDQLCVIDTGSVDGTVDYLRGRGADVRVDTRCNGEDGAIEDFAAARNAALAMARCEWVLQIDADEVLEAGADTIRERIATARGCIGVTLRSEGSEWVSGRLFRRLDAIGYRSPIHEYLHHDGGFAIARDIVVVNLPDKRGKESADERNTRILLAELGRDPANGRLWHFLGNEHRRASRDEEASGCYRRALALGNFQIGLYHSAYYLGCCRLICGDLDGAMDAARKAIAIDPRYAEAHCLLADACHLAGDLRSALHAYRDAVLCAAPPEDALMAVQAWVYGEYPRRQIATIERHLQRSDA